MPSLEANAITNEAKKLQNFWTQRNTKFMEWYRLLSQKDELEAGGMESFTSNDPTTLYKLALFLLTPPAIPVNIPLEGADAEVQQAIAEAERNVRDAWELQDMVSRKRARQGWLRYFMSLMLSTGWYSVFSGIDDDGAPFADIWNPATAYPDFDDGLSRVAHIYQMSASGARKKMANSPWKEIGIRGETPVRIVDYWDYDDGGKPRNSILMGTELVWQRSHDFRDIPIQISPVAGLPDDGSITRNSQDWKESVGESIVATNANLYKTYNRLRSFMQQIARDYAQPPVVERSDAAVGVVQPGYLGKRGTIWKVGTQEDIHYMVHPGFPPELSTQIFQIEAAMQRGGLPYALYGGQGVEGGFQQTLVTSQAEHILRDYRLAASQVLTDISNIWLGNSRPAALPPSARFKIDLKVQIPGDLIQRAATARQLSPDFKMSNPTTMDLLFPEIIDPNAEIILGRTDLAMRSPEVALVDLINAMEQTAAALKAEGRVTESNRYLAAAKAMEVRLQTMGTPREGPQVGPSGQANVTP